jgi:hypothetical protein
MVRARPITTEEPEPAQTVPFDLLDVTIIEEVSEALWKRILGKIGYPPGLTAATFTIATFIDHLSRVGASELLISVLRALHDLGTDDGVDAIKGVALAHNTDLGAITTGAPRDVAAQLWLAQYEKPELRDVYARIQMQAEHRRSPRSFREYQGKEARRVDSWKPLHAKLVPAIAKWCKQKDFGDHVEIRGFVENGDVQIQIIHGYRLQKPIVVRDRRGRQTLPLRPAHCDVVRYEYRGSRLRISPRSASAGIFEEYRRLLGQVLFGDDEFFGPAPYTLRPLQERGQAALDAAHSVSRARVIDLVWERGGARHRIKAPDCLAEVRAMNIPATEGDFVEATIAVTLPGRRETVRKIHVKLPNKVEYPRDDIHARAIETFLQATGIAVDEERRSGTDLWDLHPWQHGDRLWRTAYPEDVDDLVRRRVLKPVDLVRVPHPDRPEHGNALVVVDGFGASDDDDVPPRVLTTTDMVGLALDQNALIAAWRTDLQLEDEVRDLGDGAFLLGERGLGSVRFAVVALLRQLTQQDAALVSQRIAAATPDAHPVVLVPAGRQSAAGVVEVGFDRLVLDERATWRKIVRASSVGAQVPAYWRAPLGVRLIVDDTRKIVWFDGIELEVPADSLPYRFIATLAAAGTSVVPNETLARLSPNRDPGFVRKVKNDAKNLVEAQVAAATGRPVDGNAIFISRRGGYCLGLPPFIG